MLQVYWLLNVKMLLLLNASKNLIIIQVIAKYLYAYKKNILLSTFSVSIRYEMYNYNNYNIMCDWLKEMRY